MWTKSNRSYYTDLFYTLTLFVLLLDLFQQISCITTIHHDKPHDANVAPMAKAMKNLQSKEQFNITLPIGERQKRLLPYMNYYLQQSFNQNQHREKSPQKYRVVFPKIQQQQTPQHQQSKSQYFQYPQYNPFTESNALPGPFVPMNLNQRQPNYADIYDTLSRLKFREENRQRNQHQQQLQQQQQQQQTSQQDNIEYDRQALIRYLVPVRQETQKTQAPKPIVQTYGSVETPQYATDVVKEQVPYSGRPIEFPREEQQKVPIRQGKPIIIIGQRAPQYKDLEKQRTFEEQLRIYEDQQRIYYQQQRIAEDEQKKIQNQPNYQYLAFQEGHQENYSPQIVIQKIPEPNSNLQQQYQLYNPEYKTIIDPPPPEDVSYNTVYNNKPKPSNQHIPEFQHIQQQPQKIYENQQIQPIQTIQPTQQVQPIQSLQSTEQIQPIHSIQPIRQKIQQPINSPQTSQPNLGYILRKLQEVNALPQNLTPENIDNSIKTLIKILNVLRKHQRLSKKPIVVPDLPENEDNQVVAAPETDKVLPGTIVQNFPENTPEGGTPGTPGVDYPALSSIPQTRFNCKTQRYKGFFGDPDTNCQVWHYCDFNGGQASFLCPNGTIFSQVALTCDWWYNVKCATTPQLYVLNERLYKYILPFSPKFPEDYSGPLVDRYLALKFQEMEEKMKKERKKNNERTDKENLGSTTEKIEIDDAEQLRLKNQEQDMQLNDNDNSKEETTSVDYGKK